MLSCMTEEFSPQLEVKKCCKSPASTGATEPPYHFLACSKTNEAYMLPANLCIVMMTEVLSQPWEVENLPAI